MKRSCRTDRALAGATLFALTLAFSGCTNPDDGNQGGTGGSGPGTGGSNDGRGGSGAGGSGPTGSGGSKPGSGGSGPSGSGGSPAGTGGSGPSGTGGSGSGGTTGDTGAPAETGGTGGMGGGPVSPPAAACTGMPASPPPMLKRGAPIAIPNSGQAGQVVGVPGENVLYVIGHTNGRVNVVMNGMATGMSLIEPVAVSGGGNGPEAGNLSMALHPNFKDNQLFYVFYTGNPGGKTVIDEFKRLTPTTSMKTKTVYDQARVNGGPYHNGGSIYFNPKDAAPALYLSVGDHQSSGSAGAAEGKAGRILKIDLMSGMGTTVGRGLRNPYRMSIDRLTGDMYIGEVAQGQGGAVYVLPNGMTGRDFGWRGGEVAGGVSGMQGGAAALIGGVVYRGSKIPGLCGRYFFGMHRGGAIRSMVVVNGQRMGEITNHAELTLPGNISSFGEDGEGEIWMSAMNGSIYKIEAAN